MVDTNVNIEQGLKTQVEILPPIPVGLVETAIIEDVPETDKALSWFKDVVKQTTDAWFDPKSFEKNPEVYEKLGVKTFKKYVPTGGDLVVNFMRRHGGSGVIDDGSINSLRNYEKFTRIYETIHLVFFGVVAATIGSQLQAGYIETAAFIAGINTLVNVYPIMLQRYNRSRLYNTINKMEQREARLTAQIKQPGKE